MGVSATGLETGRQLEMKGKRLSSSSGITGLGTADAPERVSVSVHTLDPALREGVMSQLRQHSEVELQEEGVSASGTVAVLVEDVLGEAALTRLYRLCAEGTRVVLVVDSLQEGRLLEVLKCGVRVILWRHEMTAPRLVQAVFAAARGDGDLPPDLLGRLLRQVGVMCRGVADGIDSQASGLTPREVEVMRLVADGLDSGEIAGSLSCSEDTVKKMIRGMTTRLKLRSKAHAVAYAVRAGYI